MRFVAIQMLMGDKAKYFGILLGLTFASFLITQQSSIFVGLMSRTFGFLSDTGGPDIWVMDPKVQFIDDIKPMQDTMLLRTRGVEGVAWAVPLYKGILRARMADGMFQSCNVIGLDDASLAGGPPEMIEGSIEDLRRSEGVIVDVVGARTRLAKFARDADGNILPNAPKVPLTIGDTLELNDKRAVVVGICSVSRTFQSQPVIYTTYSRAMGFAPRERKLLSFIIAKVNDGADPREVCRRITRETGLQAHTGWDFSWKTVMYFMKFTGIPINFGISVTLGFLVGTAIAGQTFYNFTLDNLRHFGALKAMGASNTRLLGMILLQGLIVGMIGYGLGVGLAAFLGSTLSGNTELAFRLLWQTLAISGAAVTAICLLASLVSIQKVIRLEPAVVFKG
ncbi:MAG: FtsX-like permease family protein [Phycisphaeraceae bacterium]|nr:FtsX-like permease family protein [Phycisphaeraceae bacterium]